MTAVSGPDRAWLDQLEALRQAATPGPWATYEHHGRDYCDEWWSFLGIRSITGVLPQVAQTHPLWEDESERPDADAALIVAAVNSLPSLLAAARERDALRAAVEKLIALAPVVQHSNGYPVKAVPVAELLDIVLNRRVVADTTGEAS